MNNTRVKERERVTNLITFKQRKFYVLKISLKLKDKNSRENTYNKCA